MKKSAVNLVFVLNALTVQDKNGRPVMHNFREKNISNKQIEQQNMFKQLQLFPQA